MKNLTWQNPEQLFVAQELINKVKSKCCGIKDYFDGSWHVDWISCEEGDSIKGFTADTPEEAINEAYNWFHSTFCND